MWTLTDRSGRIKASPPAPEGWTVYDARGVPKTTARAGLFNVLDFGADRTGATETRQAFVDACTAIAAAGSGTLFVPDGTYLVDTDSYADAINLPSNCHLMMAAGAVIQLAELGAEDNNHAIFRVSAKTNVKITGGKIIGRRTGPSSGEHGFGIYILNGSTNVIVEDVEIIDQWGDGIYIGTTAPSSNIRIRNCVIDNCRRDAITLTWCDDVTIENCNLTGTNGTPGEYGLAIEPNSTDTGSVTNVRIVGNRLEGNAGAAIGLTGSQGGAIGSVTISDIIIEKNTIVRGTVPGIKLAGPNVRDVDIDGNHITGCNYPIVASTNAAGPVRNVSITRNNIRDCTATAIYIPGCQKCLVRGNQIRSATGAGVFSGTDDFAPDKLTIAENQIEDAGTYGIHLQNATRSQIEHNTIDAPADYGIYTQNCVNCNIAANIIDASGDHGIYLTGSGNGNNIIGNQLYGVGTDGGKKGIVLESVDYNNVTDNTIRPNSVTTKGISTENSGTTGNIIRNNDLYGFAAGDAIQDNGTGTVTTSSNRTA
jgi:parallel beta-helix repeat protein